MRLKTKKWVAAALATFGFATLTTALAPQASAAMICSAMHDMNPSGSVTYRLCANRDGNGRWWTRVTIVNNHGSGFYADSDYAVNIGGTTKNYKIIYSTWVIGGTSSFTMNYNPADMSVIYDTPKLFGCTAGTTYEPYIRLRVTGTSVWAGTANAGSLIC